MSNVYPVIQLNAQDDVLIARVNVPKGAVVNEHGLATLQDIPAGHKIAVRAITAHTPVKRYGQIIGFASRDIAPGEHIHLQNLEMGDFFPGLRVWAG
ncbi:UxaA family hydrolase [Acerihabitans sp. KWT182]|uniref:UxaA family hydrolase n=1 Tax=Acerihabitans sp. KWT182 TaxID=3157919 RepID=A0AAU7QBD9_9GAMM